jgi:hypothetical protein
VKRYGPEGSVVAAYDEPSDALVLPYVRCGPDKLRSVLRELGHAMTWETLAGREAEFAHCLAALPTRIQLLELLQGPVNHGGAAGGSDGVGPARCSTNRVTRRTRASGFRSLCSAALRERHGSARDEGLLRCDRVAACE